MQPLIALALKEESEGPLLSALQALSKSGHAGATEACRMQGLHRADWKKLWEMNKADLLKDK